MTKSFLTMITKDPRHYSAIVEDRYDPLRNWSVIGNGYMLVRKENAGLFTDAKSPDAAKKLTKYFEKLLDRAEHNVLVPTKKDVTDWLKEYKNTKDSFGHIRFHLAVSNGRSSWTTDVDAKQLKEVLGCFDRYDEIHMSNEGPLQPIIIWNGDFRTEALIMPIRPMEERKDDATV